MESVKKILANVESDINKTLEKAELAFSKIRANHVSAEVLSEVFVVQHGVQVPLRRVANPVSLGGGKLQITPFERSLQAEVERALMKANLSGVVVRSQGETVVLSPAPLSGEGRASLVKQVKSKAEEFKAWVRKEIRKEGKDAIERLKKNGVSEDETKRGQDALQQLVDKFSKRVDDIVSSKEIELLSV